MSQILVNLRHLYTLSIHYLLVYRHNQVNTYFHYSQFLTWNIIYFDFLLIIRNTNVPLIFLRIFVRFFVFENYIFLTRLKLQYLRYLWLWKSSEQHIKWNFLVSVNQNPGFLCAWMKAQSSKQLRSLKLIVPTKSKTQSETFEILQYVFDVHICVYIWWKLIIYCYSNGKLCWKINNL